MYAIKYNSEYDFSEQYFVDCSDKYLNTYGCNGGSAFHAMYYADETAPIPLEVTHPYVGNDDATSCPEVDSSVSVSSKNVFVINEDNLKFWLCQGPLHAIITVPENFFSYKRGVMTSYDCPHDPVTDSNWHSVVFEGWTSIAGREAVVLRNSWGTGWGQEGYAYLALDDFGNDGMGPCGMYTQIFAATIN
mmetsp:Transcript_6511/g.4633  ORF Transcript_6511/g.4633 Transcript_6511/m.4633 type:complete len:190 (-) Transcript_6511:135-704(-)|eukprot:CAMPEP_0116879744 /NCGR_PEP_ID=MMETSP0463-20121206/11564_1 /TAXON_ID=181622 /ORGANISM="Strombidinopsis sp, Strain SopsisLIS2011" /LENGTH=189 /DNA_ID=CAMNT_0004529411 /DNA_START=572 /DNA_END=1141 /DNA_ORIENTATION=+